MVKDYSLIGESARSAGEKGMAGAEWYSSPVQKEQMRVLLERRDGPAIRDTLLWFGLLMASGYSGFLLWGSWWAVIPFAIYGVLYASTSDSRWHEAGHGTAFKTDWMNNVLYEVASFMVVRESTRWRWSHQKHHTDTLIAGLDPEFGPPRPVDLMSLVWVFTGWPELKDYAQSVWRHGRGIVTPDEKTYIPEAEFPKLIFKARVYMLIFFAVIAAAAWTQSILPLIYIGLPTFYGTWLMPFYGYTQHLGLSEDVLDHRLNSRTVLMNPLNRYLYWNMNFHIEHHMYPLVPYHALPRLHELVKADMPKPVDGIVAAFREIVPALIKQSKDGAYALKPVMPEASRVATKRSGPVVVTSEGRPVVDGWINLCQVGFVGLDDVIQFDHGDSTYAIYRTADDRYFATDGMCTHGRAHLAGGLLRGCIIECPKHNGRFDVTDGSPQRKPVTVALKTYPVRVDAGAIQLKLD